MKRRVQKGNDAIGNGREQNRVHKTSTGRGRKKRRIQMPKKGGVSEGSRRGVGLAGSGRGHAWVP